MKKAILSQLAMVLAAPALFLAQAHAAGVNGYFSGGDLSVFVQSGTMQGVPVSYGLIVNDKTSMAAVYRIESVDDSTQAWMRLSQDDAGLITTNVNQEATYVATVFSGGKAQIILTPTDYGRSKGCGDQKLDQDSGEEWVDLPSAPTVFKGDHNARVTLSSTQLSGNFTLASVNYSGNFSVGPVIPKVAALRSQSVNLESRDGRSLDRKITALISVIRSKGFFGSSQDLKLIQIMGGNSCLDTATTIGTSSSGSSNSSGSPRRR